MSIILGWDPARGANVLPQFRSAAAAIQTEGRGSMPWPVAQHSHLEYGMRVHLMLQGVERGIVGLGTVRSAPFLSLNGSQHGQMSQHVMISWRALLPEEDRIGTVELAARVPGTDWNRLYSPELVLSPEDSARLDRVWLAPHPSAGAGRARRAAARLIDEPVPSGAQGRWMRSAAAL